MADIEQQASARIFREQSTHHVYRGSCGSLPCYCWAKDDHVIGDEVARYAGQSTTLATVKPPRDRRTRLRPDTEHKDCSHG